MPDLKIALWILSERRIRHRLGFFLITSSASYGSLTGGILALLSVDENLLLLLLPHQYNHVCSSFVVEQE
jgi:hypothetical protein